MHILLKKTDKYKGILVVKHSERDRLYHFLQSIKHLYNIIVHCGSMNPPTFPNFLSYNLIPKSRCINNQCIPITSSELLSKHFNNRLFLSTSRLLRSFLFLSMSFVAEK